MGKKVEYTNGELTIVWQPEMCQHATTEELIAQISKCPSGALSYRLNKKDK